MKFLELKCWVTQNLCHGIKFLASPAAESEKDGRVSATTPREKLHGSGGMDSNTSLPLLLLR